MTGSRAPQRWGLGLTTAAVLVALVPPGTAGADDTTTTTTTVELVSGVPAPSSQLDAHTELSRDGGSTWCAGCGGLLIERDWYDLGAWNLTADGTCRSCGTRCPGVFDGPPGTWGRRRQPVRLAAV